MVPRARPSPGGVRSGLWQREPVANAAKFCDCFAPPPAAAVALPCAIARAETAATEIADEGVKDPSLVAVRQRLIRIFEAGDRSALAPYLHSGIVVGSGVIGPQHVGELDAKAGKEYADRLKAGGRFARPGLFFVFYDAQA